MDARLFATLDKAKHNVPQTSEDLRTSSRGRPILPGTVVRYDRT